MYLRDLSGPRPRDVIVDIDDPEATVADLREALTPGDPPGGLLVDGRPVAAATPLDRARIGDGSEVRQAERARPSLGNDAPSAAVAVTVTVGPDAGRRVLLPVGSHAVGRVHEVGHANTADGTAPDGVLLADPTVSPHQAVLTVTDDGSVTVIDAGARNPTRVDDVWATGPTAVGPDADVCCGATRFRVAPRPSPSSPDSSWWSGPPPHPLHRRGRPSPALDPSPLVPPPEPDPPPMVTPVGMIGVLASVAVGAAMVVILGSWLYAIFALLGPVLMVANALDSRRRRRRSSRLGNRRRRADLDAFAEELTLRQERDQMTRWRRVTGPGEARAALDGLTIGHHPVDPPSGCWERRPDDGDAFTVRVGVGDAPWNPPVAGSVDGWPRDVAELVSRHRSLTDVPLALRLLPGAAVAVVGTSEGATAMVRSIVTQSAVAHGPADLQVAVLAGESEADRWDWCCWLPHAIAPDLGGLVAVGLERTATLADALVSRGDRSAGRAPLRLVVIDDRLGLAARRSGARTVLRAGSDADVGLVPVVLVSHRGQVPAVCTTVLEVDEDGTLHGPTDLVRGRATVVGTAEDVAATMARGLARLEDPEVDDPGRGLPDRIPLVSLLGTDRLSPAGIGARWSAAGADPSPAAVLGATTDGPLVIDLVSDGPHALVAGTTGSGKSELLRTLVLSLASTASPRHLTFVLIDFKGGSAFDACARLPHTCGVVTDLDDHLAARALRCLEAELRYREQRLRHVGADDLSHLRRIDPDGEPLPRLVVVVDEFATLASELPDFVDSLVGVAQRGRSLGVHLVLATQRPSGAVSESIRANLSLRMALRVQSPADSTDVIDDPTAACLPRGRPGRALVRLGPGELVPVQTALATATALDGGSPTSTTRRVRVTPLTAIALGGSAIAPGDPSSSPSRTDLEVVVEAMTASWSAMGGEAPRRPWPDPLPDQVDWPVPTMAPAQPSQATIGLADDPDGQRQVPHTWDLAEGPLLLVGLPGSGTTTALATVALEVARRSDPAHFHIHALDLGAGDLNALAGLPHLGAVVHGADLERQRRLVADLHDDLTHRSAHPDQVTTRRLVLVDGLGAFRTQWDEIEPSGTWDRFLEVLGRGGEVGIHVAMTADGPSSAPHQVVGICRQRLIFRLGDRADHATFAIPAAAVPALVPGRALTPDGPTVVQVARPPDGLAGAVARIAGAATPPAPGCGPAPVGRLPRRLPVDQLDGVGVLGDDGSLALPIGRSDVGLATAHLTLPPAGHGLVAGPPRSGRSTALQTLGLMAQGLDRLTVVAVTRSPEPWRVLGLTALDPTDEQLGPTVDQAGPLLVLVDDADLTTDDHPVLAPLVTARRADRHVVASTRSDRARSLFGHWIREVRADRTGVLLMPDLDVDGDLTGARLPRRSPVALTTGRGWLSGGTPEGFLQVADHCP